MTANRFNFRAWDGNNMYSGNDLTVMNGTPHGFGPSGKPCWLDDILMQSTGLTDMRGTELFEGDIVVKNLGCYDGVEKLSEYPLVVAWTNDGESYRWGWDLVYIKDMSAVENRYYGGFDADEVVIIGNIHQNPELLENNAP